MGSFAAATSVEALSCIWPAAQGVVLHHTDVSSEDRACRSRGVRYSRETSRSGS